MQKKELVLIAGLVFIALGLLTGCPRRPQIKETAPGAIGPAVPPRAMTATPEVPKPSLPPEGALEAKGALAEGRAVEETPAERTLVPGGGVTGPQEGLPPVPSTKGPEGPPRKTPEIARGEVRTPEVIVRRPVEEQRPEEQVGIHEEVPTFPKAGEETFPLGLPRIGEEALGGPAEGSEAPVLGAVPSRPVEEVRRGEEPEGREERPLVGPPEVRAEGLKAPVTKPGLAEEEGKAPEVSALSPRGVGGPSLPAERAFPSPSTTGEERKEVLPEAPSEAPAMTKAPELPPSEEGEKVPTRQLPTVVSPESPEAAVGQERHAPAFSEEMAPGQETAPSTGEEARVLPPVAEELGAPEHPQVLARVVEPSGVPESPPQVEKYPEFAPPVYAPEVPKAPEPVLKAEVQAMLPEAPIAVTAPPPVEAGERPLQDIFFNFNESLIRETDRVILDQNAAWLRAHPSVRIIIEGHCDERGTNEYNLALGERRARAAKEYLVAAGVDPGRIVTVSYGEERPFVLGHDEEAWRWNRRAHFVILAP